MKLTKIHRVIQFQQSRWLQPYIAKNTNLRTVAKSEMEKEFFNLMTNSIYGKTCDNQAKHTDIRILTDTTEFQSSQANRNVKGSASSTMALWDSI